MNADYHVHTSFSDDSEYPMEEVVKKAISLGLQEICFTEHVDHGVKAVTNCDYPSYVREFERCSEIYGKDINLKLGIEFGVQVHTMDQFQKDFDSYDFDFVIMSCHQVEDKEFWTKDFQKGRTQKEYNEKYYEEILNVIRSYKDYSVLGHLDMIKRYDDEGEYPFNKVEHLISEILRTAIHDGKGIEVNTSSFRYGLNDLTPSLDILKLYKSLGGEIITIGSDSHKEPHLGYKIDEIQSILKGLGFEAIHTFSGMKPEAHAI